MPSEKIKKIRKKYDVVIIGAGPAGGQCARYIVKNSKYSVLILERSSEVGEPKKSTAGTPLKILEKYELPRDIVMEFTDSFILESENEKVILPIDACVLEFGKLNKFLVKDSLKNGCELLINSNVLKGIFENDKIKGVEFIHDNEKFIVEGNLIIDASGPYSVIADKLCSNIKNKEDLWAGLELEMMNLKLDKQKSLLIKFDDILAPKGYLWIFTTGFNEAKVGICWKVNDKSRGNKSLLKNLKKWIKSDKRLKKGIGYESHGGFAYLNYPKKIYADNFMAIGDAISSINPIFGEGIRQAMESGVLAGKIAIKALNKKNCSSKILKEYDLLWKNNVAKHRKLHLKMNKIMYSLSSSKYDFIVRKFKKLDKKILNKMVDYKIPLNFFKVFF